MTPQPPTEPVDLTPPEFAELPVVRCAVQTLDQVAAMVAGHDGAGRAEISLEGTDFRVTLGPRRPLAYEFSEKDKRKLSETERAKLLAKWDRDLFTSARDWAVRELRALPKGMRRKVHPPRKVAPEAGEVEQLRRQLAEAQTKAQDLVGVVRMLTAAAEGSPMDDDTEEKALFVLMHWEDLPLAALRWVVEENRKP